LFFFLSKTISILAMPLTLIGISWILFWIFPKGKWKKTFLLASILLSYVFTNMYFADRVFRAWEIEATPLSAIQQSYKVGVVLTGVALTDRELNDRVYFARGADRIQLAQLLYKEGIIEKILITGGTGRLDDDFEYPEAEALAKYLLQVGVPKEDIILEPNANNTYENAAFTAAILQEMYPNEKVMLITSAFHMRRAAACFKKQGVAFDVFSGDFYTRGKPKYGIGDFLIPKHEALMLWTKLFKEWVGMLAYKVAGYI
jgi:uncharacterized SAM-binding protein YcdF (DUF218 family)